LGGKGRLGLPSPLLVGGAGTGSLGSLGVNSAGVSLAGGLGLTRGLSGVSGRGGSSRDASGDGGGGGGGLSAAFALVDPTADAFSELAPPWLLLGVGRCHWFKRVSLTNCPGLVGRLTLLRGLSDLTHLEIGGGVAADGFEYGYGHYGLGGSDCRPGGGNSDNTGRGGAYGGHDNNDNNDDGNGNGGGGGASDEPPSGFASLGHEFRIPTKGFGGRLASLRCHAKLVVLNLSGTSCVGDISVLEALPQLQVCNMASTAVEGDIACLAKCPHLTDVNFWGCGKVFGDVGCFKHCKSLTSVQFVGCRQVRGNIRVFEHTPRLWRLFFYHSQLAGLLSPRLVLLISGIRRRGGEVRLWKCGRFVLPSDLSEVAAQLRHLDLGGLTSLEGNVRVLATCPKLETVDFSHCPSVVGDVKVLERLPELRAIRLEGCEDVEGSVSVFYKTPHLEWCDVTNTGVDGSVAVFRKLKRLRKAKVGGAKCFDGLPPNVHLNQRPGLEKTSSF